AVRAIEGHLQLRIATRGELELPPVRGEAQRARIPAVDPRLEQQVAGHETGDVRRGVLDDADDLDAGRRTSEHRLERLARILHLGAGEAAERQIRAGLL